MTERKPKRRTRERVLETSLRLFNEFGEPNVTTTTISDEMEISPGNLYYHFRNKDQIVNDIFAQFERELQAMLAVPAQRAVTVEDIWLYLHVLFEHIWKFRFFYRDLSDLLSRNRLLEVHFKQLLQDKIRVTLQIMRGLEAAGEVDAGDHDLDALATNMMVVATYWLSFAYVRNPRNFIASEVLGDGAYQVMSLLAPFLRRDGSELIRRLAFEYRTARV